MDADIAVISSWPTGAAVVYAIVRPLKAVPDTASVPIGRIRTKVRCTNVQKAALGEMRALDGIVAL